MAPRQQWRGLIETLIPAFFIRCHAQAPRQQWRGLIETQKWRGLRLARNMAPRQQWRGLIETLIQPETLKPVRSGSTSAMAWPH